MDITVLGQARQAIRVRDSFSAFPESPSPRVYGEEAGPAGRAAFEVWLGRRFPLDTPGAEGEVASERSPYGLPLDVSYPRTLPAGVDALVAAAGSGLPAWRD
ncbi:MAG: phenylacetic acid degradation protein PaaN, partial [Actinomycetes bacterium]